MPPSAAAALNWSAIMARYRWRQRSVHIKNPAFKYANGMERKFFFEKKNQKTFVREVRLF
jgi:hypothetical protein